MLANQLAILRGVGSGRVMIAFEHNTPVPALVHASHVDPPLAAAIC
jgi:hypothetical protein